MDWISIATTFASAGGIAGIIMFVVLVVLFFWMRDTIKQQNSQNKNLLEFVKDHEKQDNDVQINKIDKLCDKIDLLVSTMAKNDTMQQTQAALLNDMHARIVRIDERQQYSLYNQVNDQ